MKTTVQRTSIFLALILAIGGLCLAFSQPAYAADPVYDITFYHRGWVYGEGEAGHVKGSSTDYKHPTYCEDVWVGSGMFDSKAYYEAGNDHITLKVNVEKDNGAWQPGDMYASGTVKYKGHTITFKDWGPFSCGYDWVDIRFERTAITFNYNGGRNYNQNTDNISADYYWYNANNFSIVDTYNGKNFDIENQPYWKAYPPLSSNTIFDGWWTEPTGGTRITTEDITKLSGTMTLYAHWEPYYLVQLVGGTSVTPSRGRIDAYGHHDTEVVQGSAMEPVVFTANEGYHIDHNSINDVMEHHEGTDVYTQNGVTVERISDTQYVAFGTPTGQVHIWIPNGHKYENWTTTTAATCTTAGEKERVCKYDSNIKETATIPIDSNAHSYKFNDFTWTGSDAEGYTAAKANYVCEHDASHTTSVEATISDEVTDPTCTEPGKTTYTATVAAADSPDGEKHEVSKDAKATDPTDHKWKFEDFTWTGDETDGYTAATANYVCENDSSHTTTAPATIGEPVVTDPTCTEPGKTTYTATVTATDSPDGQEHEASKDAKPTDPLQHDWGEATYKWADDDSEVTATHVCKRNAEHVETETAEVVTKVTKATFAAPGSTARTATFNNPAFEAQTKSVAIPKLTVSGVVDKAHTGKAVTQSPVVKSGNKVLKAGTDYTLSYKNNVKIGTATVTITAKSASYSGNTSVPFAIKGWKRLAGPTAFDTMEQITEEFGKAGVAIVTTNALASASNDAGYKDALAATALAGGFNAPMLTTTKGGLAAKTKSELKRMGVKKVYVVGSAAEVASKVDSQIRAMGITVVRVAGTPAAATASGKAVSSTAGGASLASASERAVACAKLVKGRSDTVIIATQNSFKDALAVSSYAYATKSPILYAETNRVLSKGTLDYIKSAKFRKAIVVGGPVALPASVESQLRSAGIAANNITRLAGSNQYKTARVIAEWACGKLANGTSGGDLYRYASIKFQPAAKLSANRLAVARADNDEIGWKDALAGAALCGRNKSVILLADDVNDAHAEAFVKENKAQITMGYVLGGTSAVPKAVMDKLVAASL